MKTARFRAVLLSMLLTAFCFDPAQAQRRPGEPISFGSFEYVRAVTASLNYVYFATTDGIIKYDKLAGRWEEPLTGATGLPTEQINRIYVDQFDQYVVIKTDFGLYQYESFFDQWYPIVDMPQLENDIKHVSTPDLILPQFDANYMGNGEFIDYYNRSFTMTDIVQDASGYYWIGTWGYGPATADMASGLMTLLPYGLTQNRVDMIVPFDSVLWMAGASDNNFRTGLTGFDPERNSFFRFETALTLDNAVTDIYSLEVDSGSVYAGTPDGLYIFDRGDWTVTGPVNRHHGLSDDVVLALQEVGDRLYVGTNGGLSMIDMITDSIYQVRFETFDRNLVHDLELVGNTLWIASQVGAFRYTLDTDRLQQFRDPDLVLFSSVLNIAQNGNEVWFSADGGVVRLDLGTGDIKSYRDQCTRYDSRPLAVNDWIVAFANDFGLTILVRGGKKDRFLTFGAGDGLASDNVLALRIEGDYLWVGTDRGLTRFLWNDPLILD